MNRDFYADVEGFERFDELSQDRHYQRAPSDWWVVVTDVVGSTKAIEAGRYKDINTLGAATLAALKNALPNVEIPFVFGGDGASALIPGADREAVSEQLASLRNIARQGFDLELRTALIPIEELERQDCPVWVGKYLLEARYPLAVFRGGGLALADALAKGDSRYEIAEVAPTETDLRHVSCRWRPLTASRGQVVALLVQDPQNRSEVLAQLLTRLEAITPGGLAAANPIRVSSMRYRGLGDMMRADGRHQTTFWSALPRRIDTFFAFLLFKLGLYRLIPKLRRYVAETDTHSDFRKFDGTLRMVLDVTSDEADTIESACQEARQQHGICYGIHRSEAALMTCYVPSMGSGGHLHFVDGGDGGYAMAAKQLKGQLSSLATAG